MADKCIVFLNEQQQQVKQGHEERNDLQCAEESKAAIEAKTVAHTPTCNTNNIHNNNNNSNHHHHQTSTSTSLSAFPNDNDTAAYLETPVLDDMEQNSTSSAADGLLLHHRHHHTHFCKRNVNAAAPKPKRLSDEFGSDGEESNDLLFEHDAVCDAENPSLAHSESVCSGTENLIENQKLMSTTVNLNRSMPMLPREHSSSSLDDNDNGGGDDDERIAEQGVSVADVVEELTNQGDEHQQHRIVIENNIFYDNTASSNSSTTITNNNSMNNNNPSTNTNVQSMDAIERRDFISEQDACESVSGSSCLLSGNSLIINRTNGDEQRLNLNLLGNTFSQGVEKIMAAAQELDASENCKNATEGNGRSSAAESANTHLSSTPTSSRRVKRSRLHGPSEASSSKGLNLSKDSDVATSSSGLVLRKHLNYSDLLQKPKHKRSPFYTNSSNDSSSSDNNQMNDDAASSNQLAAESLSLRDEPKADANLCPSCTNDAKDDDLVDGEYNEIDGEYEDDDDSQTIAMREPVDSQSVAMREPAEGPSMREPAEESKWLAAGQRMAVDWSSAGYRLTKPSTSKATASNEPSTSNRNSGCCDCSDDNVPMLLKERGKSSIVVSIRKKGDRFVEHTEYELQPISGVDSTGGHASGASTSYRRRTTSNNGAGHSSAQGNNDDANGMMNLDAESNTCADWPCESNSDCEEVCTCRDDTDDDIIFSEDELPSRDVDLSCYSISEDMLNNGNASAETPTSRVHRKRKLTETRSPLYADLHGSSSSCNESNDRKRLAVENVKHCGSGGGCGGTGGGGPSQPTTPTTSAAAMIAALRTPRSVIPTRDNPPPELSDWLNQFTQWSHVERLMAVDRLIEHCEPTQVRHMMKVIEPQFQRDFISLLPKELALQVLSYLAPKDLLRAAQTCRSWRFLCDDNLLWKEKCKQSGICIEASTDRPKRGRVGTMPPMSSPWKSAYMRQHIIETNWRSRPIRDPKILKAHDDHVITCLQFCGNRIVSGSDDNTLKVWSAITGKCLHTLVGHTGGVWSSQMANNIIISGSTDRTLKVWNADNGSCIHTLTGHTSTVRCMHLHDKKVVSGSRDATLRVWDIVHGRCLHTLVGHLAAVRCVQYDGKLVVSGAYDYNVKVWNPETEECLHTLVGHTNRVYSLQFDGIHVVSGSLDTSIRVWEAATGTCKHTLMGHQSLTSGMELQGNLLVSGNADSTVKVWDTTNGQCLQTLSGPNKHQSAVTCLQFDSRFVITSSDDGTVKLWDVRTGDFIRNLVTLESGGSGGVVWKIRSNDTKLVCAVGSRNGTEETKLMVLDFDVEGACLKCS